MPVDSFVSTCEANDVPCTHATPEEFGEVLAPMLDQPAVGVALRDPGLSLCQDRNILAEMDYGIIVVIF
jgi:hypothetical protein